MVTFNLMVVFLRIPGSGYIDSGHSCSGYSGSGHVLSGSIGTRAISGSDSHAQPRTNTGVGLSRSEAAVRMIQSRLNETNEENAALQSKIQQMEQGMAQLRQRTVPLSFFVLGF